VRAEGSLFELPVGAGLGLESLIVKLVLEISKKMLSTASTLTRALVEAMLGTVIVSVPSLAVPAFSTIGKVFPPSVESSIRTREQLTGGTDVFAASQLTV
jgi:hypothetical protein